MLLLFQIRAICTLHELDECLREFTQNRADFETLKLGPLVKLPLVYQFFKVPLDADICEMTTADVIEYLRGYLSANDLWMTKIELENFLKYIMDMRSLSSPYELGLRITSPALAIQVTAMCAIYYGHACICIYYDHACICMTAIMCYPFFKILFENTSLVGHEWNTVELYHMFRSEPYLEMDVQNLGFSDFFPSKTWSPKTLEYFGVVLQ